MKSNTVSDSTLWHAGRPPRVRHVESPWEYFLPLLITGPARPGPEKSAARIYRFTLDWLSHICTLINTFTALLMPLLGINKVTSDKMRLRFSCHLGQRRAELWGLEEKKKKKEEGATCAGGRATFTQTTDNGDTHRCYSFRIKQGFAIFSMAPFWHQNVLAFFSVIFYINY